jgi:hypothetical protein
MYVVAAPIFLFLRLCYFDKSSICRVTKCRKLNCQHCVKRKHH